MEKENIYRKIHRVQAALAAQGVAKDRQCTSGATFRYRGVDEVMNALAGICADVGLCILPRAISHERSERISGKGAVLGFVVVGMEYDLVSADDGSKHTVRVYGEAMDSGDKATNKAMSVAFKYMSFQAFIIPTEGEDKDPDSQAHTIVAAPLPAYPAENFAASSQIWRDLIADGRATPDRVIANIRTEYTLSAQQIAEINAMGVTQQ